jgi:hypothetical protein
MLFCFPNCQNIAEVSVSESLLLEAVPHHALEIPFVIGFDEKGDALCMLADELVNIFDFYWLFGGPEGLEELVLGDEGVAFGVVGEEGVSEDVLH